MASAVDRAYSWLRDNIVEGNLETGSFIDEATVCEAAGVSRTPVREAFSRLAGEQYLLLVPRRGAQVRGLGAKEMYEAFSARLALESFALSELCRRKAPPPADMQVALNEMVNFPRLVTQLDQVEYGRLDIRFHRAYVEAVDNALILRLYDSLRPMHERSSLTQARVAIEDIRELTTMQHRAILRTLSDHDEGAVLEALREHLNPIQELRHPGT